MNSSTKKAICILSLFALVSVLFVGCGDDKSSNSKSSVGTESQVKETKIGIVGDPLVSFEKKYGKSGEYDKWVRYKNDQITIAKGRNNEARMIIVSKEAGLQPEDFMPSDAKEVNVTPYFKGRYGDGKYYTSRNMDAKYKPHKNGFHFFVTNKSESGTFRIVGGYEYRNKDNAAPESEYSHSNKEFNIVKALEKQYAANKFVWYDKNSLSDADGNRAVIAVNVLSSYNNADLVDFRKEVSGYTIHGHINGESFMISKNGENRRFEWGGVPIQLNADIIETFDRIGNDLHVLHSAELLAPNLDGTDIGRKWRKVDDQISFVYVNPREAIIKVVENGIVDAFKIRYLDHRAYEIYSIKSSQPSREAQLRKSIPEIDKCKVYPPFLKVQDSANFQGKN